MGHLEPLKITAVDQGGHIEDYYLPRYADGQPYLLGTGRNAVVFLAQTRDDENKAANEYRAIKFLKSDSDQQYARLAARRFFDEIDKAGTFTRYQETLVKFYGMGVFGSIKGRKNDKERKDRDDEGWEEFFDVEHRERISHQGEEFEQILKTYDLQGPFYLLELCQGSLYDLLEKSTPWIKFPVYEAIPMMGHSVIEQAEDDERQLTELKEKYINGDTTKMSGYDILAAFKTDDESNRVRNNAVLGMFLDIARAVWQLHEELPERENRPAKQSLAHRDLKPGNIFLQHGINARGITQANIKLSDLGYVSGPGQLTTGDQTIRVGLKGAAAPGSQFFRAPEQMELPIEVRVDFEREHPQIVHIKSSKISAINKGDFLAIGDRFTDNKSDDDDLLDIGVKRIERAQLISRDEYLLELEEPVNLKRNRDLQAHIIRATGFHTDGFSLGAMLYDLISGGRNAETFYTYCLLVFTEQFAANFGMHLKYSVEDVVKILCPDSSSFEIPDAEKLTLDEKRLILQQVLEASDVDTLVTRILQISLAHLPLTARAKLGLGEKLKYAGQVQGAQTMDELVFDFIKSPAFQPPLNGAYPAALPREQEQELYEQLKNYRFRNFHIVENLLVDTRSVPIPREIIRIIVKCMLRDVEGAYYTSNHPDGYNAVENRRKAKEIYEDIQRLLKEKAFQLPDDKFPPALRNQLLFKLRSMVLPS